MGVVDPSFIQPSEHRPNLNSTEAGDDEIPVISLVADSNQLISQIRDACKKWGFFQVINHGVPLVLPQEVTKVAKQFYDLPLEDKKKVKRDEVNAMGYHDEEHTKNVRDWKEVFDYLVTSPAFVAASSQPHDKEFRILTNQWPQKPPQFRKICEAYAEEVEKLAYRLLEMVCLSLGLRDDRLSGYFKEGPSFVRLNHYPSCPTPQLALGVGRHKDAGALTVLVQDSVGGLEVKRKSDGEWIRVKPVANSFIVNIGDALQVWSNDIYQSVEHRVVVNSERERFSIPLFFFPASHVEVKPLEELVDEQNPAKFKEYIFGKFMAHRNRSDYKKQPGENIQIEHFRLSK
ncbi:hypothetical protein ACFE04_019200 [Oxalis oulophora]